MESGCAASGHASLPCPKFQCRQTIAQTLNQLIGREVERHGLADQRIERFV